MITIPDGQSALQCSGHILKLLTAIQNGYMRPTAVRKTFAVQYCTNHTIDNASWLVKKADTQLTKHMVPTTKIDDILLSSAVTISRQEPDAYKHTDYL